MSDETVPSTEPDEHVATGADEQTAATTSDPQDDVRSLLQQAKAALEALEATL